MSTQTVFYDHNGLPRTCGVPFDNEGNMPIGVLSTAEQLNNSVGDETESAVHPRGLSTAQRRDYQSAQLAARYTHDGARGQARREHNRGVGHNPVVGGRVPVTLIDPESPSGARALAKMDGKNALALRHSVLGIDHYSP